jgi:hypothetical protein
MTCACYPGCPDCPSEVECVEDARRELFERLGRGKGHPEYLAILDELRELHRRKSATYGDGDDLFKNFTTVADVTGFVAELYPLLRVIEKAQRSVNMILAGDAVSVKEYNDMASLSAICEVLRRQSAAPPAGK